MSVAVDPLGLHQRIQGWVLVRASLVRSVRDLVKALLARTASPLSMTARRFPARHRWSLTRRVDAAAAASFDGFVGPELG